MRATFDPSKLRDAFGLAASVAPARSPKEVLQSVLLTVGPGGAAVEATDLEYAIRARVDLATIDFRIAANRSRCRWTAAC